MKTHIRMIIASAIVIALALTAVSGITYSWFSDTQTTNISVTTASMDLKVSVDKANIHNSGEDTGTSVEFRDDDDDVSGFTVSYLCANTYINIPYTIKYKSDINTVARVTAKVSVSVEDATGVRQALEKITLSFNGKSKILTDITGTGYYEKDGMKKFEGTADLLSWTVNDATTGSDVVLDEDGYANLLKDNNLTISTDKGLTLEGLNFTIELESEIYQKSYVYTSYTHLYDYNAAFDEGGDLDIINSVVYDIPENRLVAFDKVVYKDTSSFDEDSGSGDDSSSSDESGSSSESTIDYTFTNVLLDFTKCTGFDYFTMRWECNTDYSGNVTNTVYLQIIPLTYDDEREFFVEDTNATGNVTISLNYNKSLKDLGPIDRDNSTITYEDDILVNSIINDEAYIVLDIPIGASRILEHDNLKPTT